MKQKLNWMLFLIIVNCQGQSENQDSYSKKRVAKHKKIDDNYIHQTFQLDLDFIKQISASRKERAKEKNKNLAAYLSNNQQSLNEFQKKIKKCKTDLSNNQENWQALDNFIKEYAEINLQYNQDAKEIHQEYTKKIEEAQIKRDNAKDAARFKAVNQEFAEIKDSLLSKNNNPECTQLLEELLTDFQIKRIAGLNKLVENENQSRRKYLKTKNDINKKWSNKTTNLRNRKNIEHQEITLSSKKNLLQKDFNKS
jgi:hypothetical protein